jgi:hypothetical protein
MQWKNSTAAPGTTKPRLIVLAQHLLIWVIWYGVNSLGMIGYKGAFTTGLGMYMLYNVIFPVLVFYGTAFLVKRWFDAQHRQELYVPAGGNGFWQQAYTAWGVVLAILVSYVALSVFIDQTFPINAPSTLLDHIDKRLIRVLPYMAAAIMYGHYRSEEEWYQVLLEEAYTRLSMIRQQYFDAIAFTDRLDSSREDGMTDTLLRPVQWKNNLPAGAKHPLAIAVRHTLLWATWFALHSLGFIEYRHTFTLLDWLLVLIDYCALVLVFYGVVFFMRTYFHFQKRDTPHDATTHKPLRQWMRRELVWVLAILGSYIALSVYLSLRFPFNGYRVTAFVYAWRYFDYALPYVMIAAMCGYFATRVGLRRIRLHGINVWGKQIEGYNNDLLAHYKMLYNL